MLKQAYFPSPVKADLSDLERYNYPERISIPEKLDENEALNVIKELTKNKALGLDCEKVREGSGFDLSCPDPLR
jgi:hypothetical protein